MKNVTAILRASAALCLWNAPVAQAASEQVVYSFCNQANCADGRYPSGGLVAVNGILYGTTSFAGGSGGGTLFSFDPSNGSMTTLASLDDEGPDGGDYGTMINVNGTLYGVIPEGGEFEYGEVFAFDLQTSTLRILYTFSGHGDGFIPTGTLVYKNGKVYGGAQSGEGTGEIYSVDVATGEETVLHTLSGSDGEYPVGGLRKDPNGFYGVASAGGANGYGTFFSIDANGAFNVLYNFNSGEGRPNGGLVERPNPGLFYGVTSGVNCGTAFQVDRSGNEKTIFTLSCTDGYIPDGYFLRDNGELYGTAFRGGAGQNCSGGPSYGCGTFFGFKRITSTETATYSFQGAPDASLPNGGLAEVNGTFYGTSQSGGAGGSCVPSYGCGTIYAITP